MRRRRALAIIERAYRGAIEQQYAHVLWLVRSLHAQYDMTAFLRGTAVLYALRKEGSVGLSLAGRPVLTLPDYEATICQLVGQSASVYVSASSLRRLGVGPGTLIDGVRPMQDVELATLCLAHDRIWYL